MTTNKIIFGFVGLIACGKGAAAKYLAEKYGASTYRFSTILRDILQRLHLEESRDNLVNLSECLRRAFGQDLLAKIIARDAVSDPKPMVVVEGIRRIEDIKYLSELPSFVLVEIAATPEVRYQRLVQRGENVDDRNKTYEEFLTDHEQPTEATIPAVIKLAKKHMDNNGSPEDLQKQIDALVAKYKK